MKIIITESQKRIILTESKSEEFGGIIKDNQIKVEKIVEEAKSQMGLNLQFFLTWGAGIGGFIAPVESFVRGEFSGLSERDILLILISTITIHFFDNKEYLKDLIKEIEKKGLIDVLRVTSSKMGELKDTFLNFVKSLGVTFHKFTNMLSYTFIIPIIPLIYQLASKGVIDSVDLKLLPIRIVGFVGTTISGIILRELIFKMVRRFKS